VFALLGYQVFDTKLSVLDRVKGVQFVPPVLNRYPVW
jgi:hypothetical protein